MTAADAAATIHSQFSQETTDQAADVAAEIEHGQTDAADAELHGQPAVVDADAELRGHQIDAGTDAETATVTAITAGR